MTRLEVYSFPVVCDAQPVTHSLGPVLALEIVAEEPRVEVWNILWCLSFSYKWSVCGIMQGT